MAYTYDNFVSAATAAGMMDSFSEEDLNRARANPEFGLSMVKLQQDMNNATTTEQRLLAQEAQNQLRKVYTTGQKDGSFTFGREQELQALTDKAVNQGSFAYDPNQDASAAALRKQYLREAERSRENTLARASAGTGGTPSSYAVTAAQQAGDYHLTQLADQQLALEQNAYQRHLQDYQKTLSDIALLTGQRDFDYAAHLQQLQQDQQKLENAMALYKTYGGTMTPEQLRDMYAAMGYLTPGVESWLQNVAAARGKYSGSPQDGVTLTEEEAMKLTQNYQSMQSRLAQYENPGWYRSRLEEILYRGNSGRA